MKKILTIIFIGAYASCSSQELPDLKTYSRDIGFNTSIILNGLINSSGSSLDLILKKQKSSNTANRFGISLFADIATNTFNGSGSYYQNDNYSLSISIGKEKQSQIGKKWIFYYGGDLAPFYQYFNQEYYYSGLPQNDNTNNDYGLKISPFLGIRFQINDRIYVATEALLRISYSRKEVSWTSYDYAGTVNSESNQAFNNFRIQALPASGVFIFYRF